MEQVFKVVAPSVSRTSASDCSTVNQGNSLQYYVTPERQQLLLKKKKKKRGLWEYISETLNRGSSLNKSYDFVNKRIYVTYYPALLKKKKKKKHFILISFCNFSKGFFFFFFFFFLVASHLATEKPFTCCSDLLRRYVNLQALKGRIQRTTEQKLWETENLVARFFIFCVLSSLKSSLRIL